MTKLLAFLKGLPVTIYLVAGIITALITALAINNAHQRELGAERILRQRADSIARVALHLSDSTILVAERAARDAAALRAKVIAEAAKDAKVQARTDSAIRATASERDAARRLLEDSLATVAQLRTTVGRLVTASVADSAAYAAERMQAAKTKVALLGVIASDTAALLKAQDAIAAALHRATTAEALGKLGKPPRGGLLGRCGAIAGYGGVVAGGAVKTGPALTLGCKLWP